MVDSVVVVTLLAVGAGLYLNSGAGLWRGTEISRAQLQSISLPRF
jgi:hypothetical protein